MVDNGDSQWVQHLPSTRSQFTTEGWEKAQVSIMADWLCRQESLKCQGSSCADSAWGVWGFGLQCMSVIKDYQHSQSFQKIVTYIYTCNEYNN